MSMDKIDLLNEEVEKKISMKAFSKFLIPSAIGVFLAMIFAYG